MKYLEKWAGLFMRPNIRKIMNAIEVNEVYDHHTGPSWQFARLHVCATPSADFAMTISLSEEKTKRMDAEGWMEAAIDAIVKSLAEADRGPLLGMRLEVKDVEYDDITSSVQSFRRVGEQVGNKIINNCL